MPAAPLSSDVPAPAPSIKRFPSLGVPHRARPEVEPDSAPTSLLSEPLPAPRNAAWIVSALQRRALDVLSSILPRHRPAVLLAYPNHPNVGENAIWLGQLALLRRLGVRLSTFSCTADDLDLDALRSAVGGGTILLHGGGTFGDLWPGAQEFRERIVAAFPNHRIVQLPQSMSFRSRAALDRTRRLFDRHARLTLLFRDQASFASAERAFNVRTLLCPDMAFGLGQLPRPTPPSTDIIVLSRTDCELSEAGPIDIAPPRLAPHVQVETDDWLEEPPMRLTQIVEGFDRLTRRHPRGLRVLTRLRAPLYERLARMRLQLGTQFLSRGRVVVTNRLHGHILCLLMDIPHLFLDNASHDNRQFFDSWTSTCTSSRWCDDPGHAVRLAQDLL